MATTPLIALAERLYRFLLMLYPAHYRQEYGLLMVQVFRDMSRASYKRRGAVGLALWWCATLLDLIRTIIEQRREASMSKSTLINPRRGAVISLLLTLPISYVLLSAVFDIKPPLIDQLEHLIVDGDRPTPLGIIIMLGMLLALPAAFLTNLLSMLATASPQTAPFRPTLPHTITGVSILLVVLLTLARQVLYELSPFVHPLGSASTLGNLLFLLVLLALPMAFLLNRLPRFGRIGITGRLTFQPTSMNLMIGAAVLLMILMIASSLMLETIACSSGIPNCD
jgi:hypothetical protein